MSFREITIAEKNVDGLTLLYKQYVIGGVISKHIVLLYDGEEEIGEFSISSFDSEDSPPSVGINIEDNEKYRGKGYSTLMVEFMLENIYNTTPKKKQEALLNSIIFADADASNGFWTEALKFNPNRSYTRKRGFISEGYELSKNFKDLWVLVTNKRRSRGKFRKSRKSRKTRNYNRLRLF
jgi:hypothetical protein